MSALLVMLLVMELGAGLGSAEASGEMVDADTMSVELSVTSREGPVVAHLVLPGEPETVRPLVDRGDGRWAATLELRQGDWRVVFEVVSSGELSSPVSLTELGIAADVVGRVDSATGSTEANGPATTYSTWLLVVAAAAGALALGLVAATFWRSVH